MKLKKDEILREPFNRWVAVGLLFLFFVSDFVYTLYIILTAQHRALFAAVTSTAVVALGFFGYRKFQRQPWYLLPILVGSALGTYFSIKLF